MASDGSPFVTVPDDRGKRPLTARERRQRITLLVVLLVLLAMLASVAYFWALNRTMPIPRLAAEDDLLPPPQYLYSITGSGENELKKPVGIDVSDNGRVYVVDFDKRRISVFTTRGRFLFSFNKTAEGTLRNPVHLQVVNGEVWVTDRRLREICVFDLEGKFKRSFEPKVKEKGKGKDKSDFKWTPLALAFDKDGNIRVTDVGKTDKHQLRYFSKDGSQTASVGRTQQVSSADAAPGSFYFPNGLAVADDGRVYVADGDNRRVQVFNAAGEFQEFIDTSGVPRGLAIDEDQRLYVVDALAHTVDVYSLEGESLTQFGERGFGPGQFNFPNDIALDGGGRIYITDRENHQVQVWGWPAVIVPPNVAAGQSWPWFCLAPLLLLPLLLLRRRRRFVMTPDFVSALVAAGRADVLNSKRLQLIAPKQDMPEYESKSIEGVDLMNVITFEEHSPTDVAAMVNKLRCSEAQAIYLTMGDRTRGVLSEDVELRRLGVVARVRILDVNEFLNEVPGKVSSTA